MKELSTYIHIPFCVRKCLYCDFLSFSVGTGSDDGYNYVNQIAPANEKRIESYVNLLCDEIRCSAPPYGQYRVISIFFGGGTPSLLPVGTVSRILDWIRKHYHVAEDAEITIEMNPETVDEKKLKEYITCGINRLSIGLQSADDAELKRIGRIHDYRTFEKVYRAARRIGFNNINIDVMSALPDQNLDDYMRTLRQVTALAPEHVSAYSLTLEDDTPLCDRRAEFRFPTDEEEREMYRRTGAYLAENGYHRYEISNYAREGFECRHNKVYWQRGNYIGFGLGAASMAENVRWNDPVDMERYQAYVEQLARSTDKTGGRRIRENDVKLFDLQPLTVREQMEEFMFLGLRMMRGVDGQTFYEVFGESMEELYGKVIDKLCGYGVLVREQGRIRLTEQGIDVSNFVMSQFLFD